MHFELELNHDLAHQATHHFTPPQIRVVSPLEYAEGAATGTERRHFDHASESRHTPLILLRRYFH